MLLKIQLNYPRLFLINLIAILLLFKIIYQILLQEKKLLEKLFI